jgi:hypothetical protein
MEYVVCEHCKHYRLRKRATLVSRTGLTAKEIEEQIKYQDVLKEAGINEQALIESNAQCLYEPYTQPWCKKLSDEYGSEVFNPINGKKTKAYVFCLNGNSDGRCQYFEKR